MNAIYDLVKCSIVELRENKSLTAIGDEECDSSLFVEVELLRDGLSWLEK